MCGNISGLTVSAINATGATLGWGAVTGATGYDVDYKLATASTWTNAATATTATSIVLSGLVTGVAYDVRVRSKCAAGNGTYAVSQFTTTAPCPGASDVSTNGTAAGAGLIALNTDIKGTISSSTDIDFYKFTIATGGTATITLTTLPANYALTLYASNGTTTLGSSNKSSTTSESIAYTFTAGTYVIKVNGVNKAFNASNCYTLRVQAGTAAGTSLTAAEFASSSVDTHSLQTAAPEKNIAVKLYPNPSQDKVTLYLIGGNEKRQLNIYDGRGVIVHRQELKEMFTTLSLQKLPNGVYNFRIVSEKGEVLFNEKLVKN